jgi:hypothetical protein
MLIVHGLVKTFGIVDRHLVGNRVDVAHRVALDHVQRLAVKVASHVEPGAIVVVSHVDDQRVPLPAAAGITHPEVDSIRVRRPVRVDRPVHLRPFECDREMVRRLEDLEWELHVHDARHARHVAVRQRVGGQPVLGVLELPGCGPRLIRDRAVLHHPPSRREAVTRHVIFQVGRGAIAHLPDPVEIWFAVGSPRDRRRRSRT